VPSVEERLATLEGRIQEQAVFMADVRGSTVDAIRELRRDVDQRFEELRRDVDQRFEHVDRRFDRVERLVMWMLGVTLTGFTAVVAAVIGSMSGLR
jgi:hypothetical protein